MQHSRKPSVVSLLDDPRFYNGNGRAIRLPQSYHEPEPKPEPIPTPNPPQPAESVAEQVRRAVEDIVAKMDGNKDSALETLIKRNYSLEQRAIKAEAARDELKGKVPDEATTKALEKLQELGGIEAVEKAINDGKEAIDERDELKRDTVKADVRDVLKVKKSPLFDTLTNGVDFKVTGEIKDGKDERAVVVVSDGKETPWDEYVKGRQDIADALPALKAEPGNDNAARVPFPRQAHGDQKPQLNEEAARKGQAKLYSPTNF